MEMKPRSSTTARSSAPTWTQILAVAVALAFALIGLSACTDSSDGAVEETANISEMTESTVAGENPADSNSGGTAPVGGGAVQGGGAAAGGGVAPAPGINDAVIVPDLFNMTKVGAEQLLRDRGLVPDPINRDNWAEHRLPQGRVTGQTPLSGLSVPRGNFVVFYVSEGPKEVLVPNVVGMCESVAFTTLRNAGFDVRFFEVASAQPFHRVVEQDPLSPPGVRQGTPISLQISNNSAQQCR